LAACAKFQDGLQEIRRRLEKCEDGTSEIGDNVRAAAGAASTTSTGVGLEAAAPAAEAAPSTATAAPAARLAPSVKSEKEEASAPAARRGSGIGGRINKSSWVVGGVSPPAVALTAAVRATSPAAEVDPAKVAVASTAAGGAGLASSAPGVAGAARAGGACFFCDWTSGHAWTEAS